MADRPQSDPPTDIADQCLACMHHDHGERVLAARTCQPTGGRGAALARQCMGV